MVVDIGDSSQRYHSQSGGVFFQLTTEAKVLLNLDDYERKEIEPGVYVYDIPAEDMDDEEVEA